MTTIEALDLLLAQIETIVPTAGVTCEIDLYRVTAGLAPAPAGACSAISVWASQYFNASASLFHEDSPCLVSRGVQLNWRIDLCYSETEEERSEEEHHAVSACLYGLSDAIWCGILSWLSTGVFGRCSDLAVDPLTVNEAQGGIASAESGFRFQLDCTEPAS